MANVLTEQWVYPPNWDGNPPEKGGWRKVTKRFTCVSDGTDETDAIKIDISELRTINGIAPTRTAIEYVKFNRQVFSADSTIKLEWDRAPASTICVIASGDGELNFTETGGLPDPSAAGDRTGDILLSSVGGTSGDAYDITICLKLKDS